ncbi:hypothetical protein ACJ73_01249 [Blastomyces percursus]|uniref:MalT-like TPR region domain-containing protein n=1 Tax=Blastomyces percursus TaxID=1658174 RepID=A0A1J9RIB3_9EURO|nr:hypothetical protein ACJ73_01249 [Blastomyces percursus]
MQKTQTLHWALLLYHVASFALLKGNMIKAEEMAVKAMKTWKVLCLEHELTLRSISMVGLMDYYQGSYNEAEAMH